MRTNTLDLLPLIRVSIALQLLKGDCMKQGVSCIHGEFSDVLEAWKTQVLKCMRRAFHLTRLPATVLKEITQRGAELVH